SPQPRTPHLYTLSLHDALPISRLPLVQIGAAGEQVDHAAELRLAADGELEERGLGTDRLEVLQRVPDVGALAVHARDEADGGDADRKSTRLNSSHDQISYAVFC